MSVRSANLAIVFTDIKGFTERTSRQTLEQNQQLLSAHERVLVPIFKAFGGRVIKTIGDAFLVTFESPTNAVLSGIAIQDRVWQHDRTAPEVERFEVRVAINVGEVRLEGNDIFGEPVNIAARVEGLADAGEVFFTEAVYLVMNKAEVPAEEVGQFELKGIPGKVRVYKVPRAPHRIAATPVPGTEPSAVAADQAPYGNLGLQRMPEHAHSAAADFTRSAIEQSSAVMNKAVSEFKAHAPSAIARLRAMPRVVLVGLGATVAVVLALMLLVGGSSKTVKAIDAVATASAGERPTKVAAARKLIAAEKNDGRRLWLEARLMEVQDDAGAANQYEESARAGYDAANDALVRLLGHSRCRMRSAAAASLGSLKAKSAKSSLETLAEKGGEGDGAGGVLGLGIGACDSRRAARAALTEL